MTLPDWQYQHTGSPDDVDSCIRQQEKWLADCLFRNRHCDYAKAYKFYRINSVDSYRENVPPVSYGDIEPLINEIKYGRKDVLFDGVPIAMERTGGSTGGSKIIPYSRYSLADFRQALNPWLSGLLSNVSATGSIYWSISPAIRASEKTAGGISIGVADHEYLAAELAERYLKMSAVPVWIAQIEVFEDWQLATLYWLVCYDDLELVSVWSPTFFINLMDALSYRTSDLNRLLNYGGSLTARSLPADQSALNRLQQFAASGDYAVLWPNLKRVSCWADASSLKFFNQLKARLPGVSFQPKGLISTEGVVTIPNQDGLPLLSNRGFYEFLDQSENLFLSNELKPGRRYEIVMTTAGGLYRYRTGDLVNYEGVHQGSPVLRFSGRAGITSDLVGEKLTDGFISDCLSNITEICMLIPGNDSHPGYVLLVDTTSKAGLPDLVRTVENRLLVNPQYAYARKIGQLNVLSGLMVPDILQSYYKYREKQGQRIGDIKFPSLCTDDGWIKELHLQFGSTQ